MKISLTPNTNMQQVPQSSTEKSTPPYSVSPHSQSISKTPGQDKQNDKQALCLLPLSSSGLTSKLHPLLLL